ncbi:hypothetical protein J4408_03925 [Candidatus Pacearchaeota archaeon]|nr:hypothetical protein [Candidatus Pacearchaeota archaeon]
MKRVNIGEFYLCILFMFIIVLFAAFVTSTSYGSNDAFCGDTTVSDNSVFTANQECDPLGSGAPSENGGILDTVGIFLDCATFTLIGDGTGIYGIRATADNINITRCTQISAFTTDLDLQSNNVFVVDSVLADTATNHLVLAAAKNATILNVTFNAAKVTVGANSNLSVQYYVNVTVNNTKGQIIQGADVWIYNSNPWASRRNLTTGVKGTVWFNVTDKIFSPGTNVVGSDFVYTVNATYGEYFAQNTTFNLEATTGILTVHLMVADTTKPFVTIINPTNVTYKNSNFPLNFNVSVNENASVMYTLDGGLHNVSMTGNESLSAGGLFGTRFNATNGSLADGSYTFSVYANDTSNNRNYTEGIVFSVDRTSPGVTINLPTSTTKTVNNYLINLTLSESGYCEYSLDGGSTNETLTNNGNIDFNSTEISVANADYTLAAYCNDSIGNRNYTTNVSFSVSVSSGGGGETPGGGGGGGTTCSATTWTCGAWGICFDGKQTRECTSNCNTKRTETQSCSLTCEHDTRCSQEGVFCSGNEVVTCELNSEGCLDFVSSVVCEDDEICSNAQCVLKGKNAKNIFSGLGHWGNYSTPSDWIPHGNIPDIVIDAGAGVVSVGVIGGIIWWIVLLVIGSIVPFFLIKLRHYSVSVIDFSNKLNIFEGERLNHGILEKFINTLEETYGKMTIANANYEVLRLLGARGFVEIRIDSPFAIIGHFSNKKDCELFENGLKKALEKTQGGAKIQVTKKIERASIIGAWRAYRRKLRSQREIRKLVR